MPEQPDVIILCSTVAGTKPYPGSEQRHCASCSVTIWVSPASIMFMTEHPNNTIQLLCAFCGPPAERITAVMITHEHVQELLAWERRN